MELLPNDMHTSSLGPPVASEYGLPGSFCGSLPKRSEHIVVAVCPELPSTKGNKLVMVLFPQSTNLATQVR